MYEHAQEHSDITVDRRSEDMILNDHEKLLPNKCTAFSLGILNGVCNGDL